MSFSIVSCISLFTSPFDATLFKAAGKSMAEDMKKESVGTLNGKEYFYVNPLANRGDHRRQKWFGCACCPPNIARLMHQFLDTSTV
jgi:hypothetical protein